MPGTGRALVVGLFGQQKYSSAQFEGAPSTT
jgi:hypothetical protein